MDLIQDPERRDPLRPTAGYISQLESHRLATNKIAALKNIPYMNKVFAGLDRPVKEFLALPLLEQSRLKSDLKLKLANPTIISEILNFKIVN